MARVIAAVLCFVVAFHAVAERPQKASAYLERETSEAKRDRDGILQDGFGRTSEEYTTEGRGAQGGHSAKNVSLAELGSLDVKCMPPEDKYPAIFPERSTTPLEGGAAGDVYKVSLSCQGNKDAIAMVMKSVGVLDNDPNHQMLLERAWTEIFVGESLLSQEFQEPALASTIAHTEPSKQDKGTCFYMLMEYFYHGDLQTALKEKKLKLLKYRARIFHESLLGLARLHKRGIVHRDIKPENIFLQKTKAIFEKIGEDDIYQPRIGDFGVSCYLPGHKPHLEKASVAECENVLVGSPVYMSPGTVKEKQPTFDDDLWSMGKLLLQLVYNQAEMVVTEKQTDTGKRFKIYEDLDNIYGKPLLSKNDKDRLNKLDAAGDGTLVALLDYLLCNGCPGKEKQDVDAIAMDLSKKWLEKLKVAVPDPPMRRLDTALQNCREELIKMGAFQHGLK